MSGGVQGKRWKMAITKSAKAGNQFFKMLTKRWVIRWFLVVCFILSLLQCYLWTSERLTAVLRANPDHRSAVLRANPDHRSAVGEEDERRVREVDGAIRWMDAIHVNAETDVLLMRFAEYDDFVDEFHVFETNLTNMGTVKPLHFAQNRAYFGKYADKIRYHRILPIPEAERRLCSESGSGWKWWKWVGGNGSACEKHNRRSVGKVMNELLRDEDVLVFSDADEIVDARTMQQLKDGTIKLPAQINPPIYKYSLHWKQTDESDLGVTIGSGHWFKTFDDYNNVRLKHKIQHTIKNKGWHLSTCCTMEQIRTKLSSNKKGSEQLNDSEMERRVRSGISLWDANTRFTYQPDPPAPLPRFAVLQPLAFQVRLMEYDRAPLTTFHNELRHAASYMDWFQNITLLRTELNCNPHFPQYGEGPSNMIGSIDECLTQRANNAHCTEIQQTTGVRLSIDTEGQFRTVLPPIEHCAPLQNDVWSTSISWTLSGRRPWRDIPIPTPTFPHPGYPKSAAENNARCNAAKHDATFKGHGGNSKWGQERDALRAFTSTNGFVIEFNSGYGEPSERMTQLLHESRFGLAPAGDGWHSYRLMEIMAMGVVPIILSDEWALPFEDILDWTKFSIRVSIDDIPKLPSIVAEHRDRACNMSQSVFEVYHRYMANATQIMKGIESTMRRDSDS